MDTPLGGAFVSLLLGLLLGLERERAKKAQPLFAGIRTLPLIALCGF
ncbi:MAG TPA: MgtC/SapB family protein, partial [Candidatus Polarisedimenticolia bacterium]